MKFRTNEGQAAYKEMLDDLSERAIRMYAEVKTHTDAPEQAIFMMNLAVESFQQEGLARAIKSGIEVDAHMMSVQGCIAAAVMKD